MGIPTTITNAVQTTQTWLNELCDNGELADPSEAVAVLRSVLHQLRDRLTVEEAVDLSAQLPMIIRGMYFEGWQPKKVPIKVQTKQQFIDDLAGQHFPNAVPTERAVRDVFALLAHHCDPGEISDVIEQLPQEIKELWPQSAQTFRKRTK
jgi:uncharacterized protein (DUF2267 family)